MVSTRSASGARLALDTAVTSLPTPAPTPRKRRSDDQSSTLITPSTPSPLKKRRSGPSPDQVVALYTPLQLPAISGLAIEDDGFVPTLSFDLSLAKAHLIAADERFREVFAKVPCKPFEVLDTVRPFRVLVTSILGQQISWRAARSIVSKFLRLYDPTLPERGDVYPPLHERPFPTPYQVGATDIATLRSAGLSGRKAEYVLDLASHFADGRLSPSKLESADDESMAEMLIAVRGIGRWTVDMFSIFAARRPDIMPSGDLGVQRGLLRWVLASHDPKYRISVEAKKVPEPNIEAEPETIAGVEPDALEPDASAIPPVPVPTTPKRARALPTPPSSPEGVALPPSPVPVELPESLTASALKSRLAGKTPKKGVIFKPEEVEVLTESWKPYRSIGAWYMWAVEEVS